MTILPGEIYAYGASIFWIIPMFFVNALIGIYVFMPVFFKLEVNTIFEYIEKRFDGRTKIVALVVFIFQQTFTIAYIIYTSALVFATDSKGRLLRYFSICFLYFLALIHFYLVCFVLLSVFSTLLLEA